MFELRCSETGGRLALVKENEDRWWAELEVPGLTARTSIYAYRGDVLGDFFAELARDWRGFEGVRSWGSLEGELTIEARSDRLGHTRLDVNMVLVPDRSTRCEAALVVEAGSLDGLAAQARAFVAGS